MLKPLNDLKDLNDLKVERILFAVGQKQKLLPLFVDGDVVENELDQVDDWGYVNIDGIPANPGLYVWEGIPKPIYYTDNKYIEGYRFKDCWRVLDAMELLKVASGKSPWESERKAK